MAEASLIPMADTYLENNLNILLIGMHGTGKTQSIFDLAEKHNIKVKYYSCSTLDPYTDLVGIPVPRTDEHGREHLTMVRPRDVDEAELIFFDEFNRADVKTLNAVFEIIQFKSINGEPLPNLRCCWAAMNPPDKDYNVEELDVALMDRFDQFIEIKPKPSVNYMAQKLPKEVATALKSWWDEQNRQKREFKNYISPRRLEKIGLVYMATGNAQAVKYALPPGGSYDITKLVYNLEVATGKRKPDVEANDIGTGASDKFTYTPRGIYNARHEIIKHLEENPKDLETNKKIIDIFRRSSLGSETLINYYAEIFDAMNPALVEGYFNSLSSTKRSQVRSSYQNRKRREKNFALPRLESILGKNARTGNWTASNTTSITTANPNANIPF